MAEQKTTALDALEAIKGIVLSHMEQDVDYDYEENAEYSYHEEYDGTVGDNYPCEVAFIEKALKALEIIHSHLCGMGGAKGSAEGPNEYVISLKDLTKEEYAMLEEVIR